MQANHTPTCAHCGAVVTLSKSQKQRVKRGGAIYCDRQCYQASRVTETEQRCAVCGGPFMARADNLAKGYARYCSKVCSNRARALPEAERFWALVDRTGDGCWLWQAARDKQGYGLFTRDGHKQIVAHRMAYELTYGPVDAGTRILHRCDNPPCCWPQHLFPGTDRDNSDDKVAKGRHLKGEQIAKAKLTEEQVREIRHLAATGTPVASLAGRFNVTAGAIYFVLSRYTWKHVE